MLRVQEAVEPASFDVSVRRPGNNAIAELCGLPAPPRPGPRRQAVATSPDKIPAKDFPAYWREAADDLQISYGQICAYSCFRIHPVTGANTVDHFVPKSKNWNLVYEWSNYRLAAGRLNSLKREFTDVLDPFIVEDDWFQLEFVGYQVVPNPNLDAATTLKVEQTIERLNLGSFAKDREEHAYLYFHGEVTINHLERHAPFVASEIIRQRRTI